MRQLYMNPPFFDEPVKSTHLYMCVTCRERTPMGCDKEPDRWVYEHYALQDHPKYIRIEYTMVTPSATYEDRRNPNEDS